MPEAYGPLSGPGPQQIYVICYPVSHNQAGNYSTWYAGVAFVAGGGTSWINSAQYWSLVTNYGHVWSGSFTIPSPGTANINLAGVYFNISHDANGYLPADVIATGSIDTNHATIGDGSIGVNGGPIARIPKPSAAPSIAGLGWSLETTDSARFQFSAAGDSGGGAHVRWDFQYWKTGGPATIVSSSGTTDLTGLEPGAEYNGQARQVTQSGIDGSLLYGAWSAVDTTTLLAGVYVSDGAAWVPVSVKGSSGSAWSGYDSVISDGDSWEDPVPL